MKKIVIYLTLVIFMTGLAYAKGKVNKVRGRIIYTAADFFEIKKGRPTHKIHYADTTVVMKNGEKLDVKSVVLCQTALVYWHVEADQKIADKIEILKDSDCE